MWSPLRASHTASEPSKGLPEDQLRYSLVVRRFLTEEEGQDLIEYGLLLGMIVAGLIVLLPTIQTRMGVAFTTLGSQANNTYWVPLPPAP